MRCVKNGANKHIPIPIPSRCGTFTQFLASQRVPVGNPHGLVHTPPHLRLGNGSNTIYNDAPKTTQYCPLLAPLNQTSLEVTHLGTTLTKARLIAEFGHHGFKMHCVKNGANIYIRTSSFPYSGNVGRQNHSLLGPSVPVGYPHGVISFLESQRMPVGDPHGLVHAPLAQVGQWL
jgi:hypothetical protein